MDSLTDDLAASVEAQVRAYLAEKDEVGAIGECCLRLKCTYDAAHALVRFIERSPHRSQETRDAMQRAVMGQAIVLPRDVEKCPYCHIPVILGADGTCPSCRQLVRVAPLPQTEMTGMPSFADRDAVRQAPLAATDSANPYAPPAVSDRPLRREMSFQRSGLAWILFSFEGRIPRRVFWGASLLYTIVFYAIVFGVIAVFGEESVAANVGILAVYPFVIWASLAVSVKRWHDLDKSGWWVLIGLIPCIGPLWAFIETGCLRGTFGDNDYGPDPT